MEKITTKRLFGVRGAGKSEMPACKYTTLQICIICCLLSMLGLETVYYPEWFLVQNTTISFSLRSGSRR